MFPIKPPQEYVYNITNEKEFIEVCSMVYLTYRRTTWFLHTYENDYGGSNAYRFEKSFVMGKKILDLYYVFEGMRSYLSQ